MLMNSAFSSMMGNKERVKKEQIMIKLIQNKFFFSCPSHNARIVQDWLRGEALEEHRIKTLWWPAYSPDLNPIENFWGFMVRNMGQMEVNNAEDVYDWIFQFWEVMENNQAYWQSLIESMPTRLARVLELNGDMTEY
jgi:hypothetical protein